MSTTTIAVAPISGPKPGDTPAPLREIFGVTARKVPKQVLVVDDEPLLRWSIAETLAAQGLNVEQAGDASSALRQVSAGRPSFDVIVLDLRLPDMHDLSLLGTLRQLLPEASIIVMTAFGTDEVVERAIALGARAVLQKPFGLGALVDAVYLNWP